MIHRTTIAALFAVLCAGCSTYTNSHTRNAELTWLVVHAIDTAQTVTIARSPECLWEDAPLARMVYGTKHPSVERVLVTNTAMAWAHWQLGAWLDSHTQSATADEGNNNAALWHIGRFGFYALSFAGSGTAVIGNVRLGIKPLSRARCGD